MIKHKRILSALAAALTLTAGVASAANSADWVYVSQTRAVDRNSISTGANGAVSAWLRTDRPGISPPLAIDMYVTFDCAGHMSWGPVRAWFQADKPILSQQNQNGPVVPGSEFALMAERLCQRNSAKKG